MLVEEFVMSRVGKKLIPVPEKTQISVDGRVLTVKGPKGSLLRELHPDVAVNVEKNLIRVDLLDADKGSRAVQGLSRSLIANMVHGVTDGFEKVLEINGIGYRASIAGQTITFNLGYSHPIDFILPSGISGTIEKNNIVKLNGIDKELLGHTASAIRRLKPPEPYKGKGIKYAEERIQRKAGKTGTK
jgi:large subunit ribosomal protein L6